MARTFTYSGDEPVRINKWLAQSGVCSRREAEGLITDGLVSVEGEKISSPGHKILPGQSLSLAERVPASGAIKNHIGHGIAAQLAGGTFAQYPADGVHHVGLAAAVRPHHRGQVAQ
jgi:hypothetical protein